MVILPVEDGSGFQPSIINVSAVCPGAHAPGWYRDAPLALPRGPKARHPRINCPLPHASGRGTREKWPASKSVLLRLRTPRFEIPCGLGAWHDTQDLLIIVRGTDSTIPHPPALMHWVAPSENDALTEALEKRIWDSAAQFGAKRQIQNFRQTRDLLLPRPLSRQVNLEGHNV
jgi:hypothetical protein